MKMYDPAAWSAFEDALTKNMTAHTESLADQMSAYPSLPVALANSTDSTVSKIDQFAARYAGTASMGRESEDIWIDSAFVCRTHLQLLAVHAAILRWRWETNSVPENLSALHLGPLAIDVFTGQSLSYTRLDSTHYSLVSAGPIKRDNDLKPRADGKREPVTLTFADP